MILLLTKEYRKPFTIALLVHLVVVGLLFFSMDMTVKPVGTGTGEPMSNAPLALPGTAPAVDAVMVDGAKLDAEVKRLQQEEQQKEQKALQQQKQLQRAKEERRQEEAKLQQLKKDAEKALALAAKHKKEEEAKLAKMKTEQEKLNKELNALKEQKKKDVVKEEETTRAAEEEKERKELVAQVGKAQKKTLENSNVQSGGADQGVGGTGGSKGQGEGVATEMQRISSLIHDKIKANKQRIPGLPGELTTVLKFRILPDGTVLGVKVVESSGNTAYDNVSINAVLKASPLPVSSDPAVMRQLQDVTLKVKNDD